MPKIKDSAYVINLDEYESIGTNWIVFYTNGHNIIYFDCFVVEHIPKEVKKSIGNENVITNIYRMQACNSIMCGHFCTGFINFILNGKSFLD